MISNPPGLSVMKRQKMYLHIPMKYADLLKHIPRNACTCTHMHTHTKGMNIKGWFKHELGHLRAAVWKATIDMQHCAVFNVLKLSYVLPLRGFAEVRSSLHFQLLLWPSGVKSHCEAPKPIADSVCQTELVKIFGFNKSLLGSRYTHFYCNVLFFKPCPQFQC